MQGPLPGNRLSSRATARLVLDLLGFAAGARYVQAGGPVWERGASSWLEQNALEHVVAAGLAPLLHEAAGAEVKRLPGFQRERLLAASFSALLRHDELVRVVSEVVEVGQKLRIPVTLLKGISISEQHYPAPHLRPMGDIDILVSSEGRRRLQSALQQRGYRPHAGHWDDHPHAAPLCHPEAGVWVEVHDALFPRDSPLASGTLFGPASVAARSEAHMLRDVPVHRLNTELQLVYVASTWARDLSRNFPDPSFLVPLFDAVRLLRDPANHPIDWGRMIDWLDNETAAASSYVMLAYLDRHGLAGGMSSALPTLAGHQKMIGPFELSLLHTMLDRWLLGGRTPAIGRRSCLVWDQLMSRRPTAAKLAGLPWRLLFPADVPDRFSAAHLRRMASRLASTLGSR